jgi:glycosyltransferase involved in cell wall biosynthesis
MRILYVTADLPWPLTSGYLRHFHFLRALGERHDVTLLSLMGPAHTPADVAALERVVARVVTEPATRGARPFSVKVADRLRMLVAGGDTAALRLGETGGRLARTVPFDVLLLSGKRTMPVLAGLPPMPLVADLCDATSIRIRRQMRHAPLIDQPALALEYVEIRRVERALTHRARHAIFASARDRAAVVGPTATRGPDISPASVVPNGVDLDVWHRQRRELGLDEIVFTGAMDYPPNADAAVQLVEHVLPLVRREMPSARVTIVGRDPTPRVRELAEHDGVTVTGYVDHVRPYLERAAVFAAPIRYGAGIQNKVLEALAMEVPVVASPLAADGLRTQDGDVPPVAVTRGPTEMAEQVVARLREAAAGATADPALRAYVAAHFDWTTNADRLEAILVDAAGDRVTAGDGAHADAHDDADDDDDDVDVAGIPA